jgi:hypothetical protein
MAFQALTTEAGLPRLIPRIASGSDDASTFRSSSMTLWASLIFGRAFLLELQAARESPHARTSSRRVVKDNDDVALLNWKGLLTAEKGAPCGLSAGRSRAPRNDGDGLIIGPDESCGAVPASTWNPAASYAVRRTGIDVVPRDTGPVNHLRDDGLVPPHDHAHKLGRGFVFRQARSRRFFGRCVDLLFIHRLVEVTHFSSDIPARWPRRASGIMAR